MDQEGNTAMHSAAARGDVAVTLYQPWPEALVLLEKLGAVNDHKRVSC